MAAWIILLLLIIFSIAMGPPGWVRLRRRTPAPKRYHHDPFGEELELPLTEISPGKWVNKKGEEVKPKTMTLEEFLNEGKNGTRDS